MTERTLCPLIDKLARCHQLTEAEYAALEKTHICCTVADVSDDRGVPLPHFHVEGS